MHCYYYCTLFLLDFHPQSVHYIKSLQRVTQSINSGTVGWCLKWIHSQESTPDRSLLRAVYNWLIHNTVHLKVSEVYVFFPKQTLEVGSLQTCQRGKENQCLRQCGMSLSLHFIGMFTTVEFRMKLLELVVYRAAIGHKQNGWLKTASSELYQIE